MAIYLVTGGAGFIGSHLVESLLAAGDRVRVLDDLSTGKRDNLQGFSAGVELVVGDAGDPAQLVDIVSGTDGVFHLAAVASVQRSAEDWIGTHRTNVGATVAVLDAARQHGRVPVIYASSAAVYGDHQDAPFAETLMPRPLSAYGADKLGSEMHARAAWHVHGVATVGLRFFNVYGPRQDPGSPYSGVISIFADRLSRGEAVHIYGDGAQTRDFVHVGDVVRCLRRAMDGARDGSRTNDVVNVGTGRGITILDLADLMGSLLSVSVNKIREPARPGDIRVSLADTARLREILDFRADTPLAQGLRETLTWIQGRSGKAPNS